MKRKKSRGSKRPMKVGSLNGRKARERRITTGRGVVKSVGRSNRKTNARQERSKTTRA